MNMSNEINFIYDKIKPSPFLFYIEEWDFMENGKEVILIWDILQYIWCEIQKDIILTEWNNYTHRLDDQEDDLIEYIYNLIK
jgi:hypothetical protein